MRVSNAGVNSAGSRYIRLPTMMNAEAVQVKHHGRRTRLLGLLLGLLLGCYSGGREVTRLSISHSSPTFCIVTVTWFL